MITAIPKNGELCPVTVVMDRYCGAYSRGEWLAFNCDPQDVPEEPWCDDCICDEFWHFLDEKRAPVGKGATPDKAYEDLVSKMEFATSENTALYLDGINYKEAITGKF
jgi:hypothetical protein